jgi:D-mannonate dehydratase
MHGLVLVGKDQHVLRNAIIWCDSRALYFERSAFIAFDLFLLRRPGAEKDYIKEEIRLATERIASMDKKKQKLFQNVLLGLPGSDEAITSAQVLDALKKYAGINASRLKEHLFYFLREIIPVTEERGLKMAIHPDDPLPCVGSAPCGAFGTGCGRTTDTRSVKRSLATKQV